MENITTKRTQSALPVPHDLKERNELKDLRRHLLCSTGSRTYLTRFQKPPSSPSLQSLKTGYKEQVNNKRCLESYFASTPGDPINITLFGPHIENQTHNDRIRQLGLNLEETSTIASRTPVNEWDSAFETAGTFCTPRFRTTFHTPSKGSTYDAHATNTKMVHSILNNLIASLPTPKKKKICKLSRNTLRYRSFTSKMGLSSGSDRSLSSSEMDENMEAPEFWLYGARELRDSHVRLVKKQLRHIERLNRLLDQALLSYTNPL